MMAKWVLGTALTGALALGSVACADTTTNDTSSSPDKPKVGKFEQTWKKNYTKTTCAEWTDSMNEHETFVAASDMLLDLRRADDPNSGLLPDVINEFKQGITKACVGDLTISDVAVVVYTTDTATFKP